MAWKGDEVSCSSCGRGTLHTANFSQTNVPPVRVTRSTVTSFDFSRKDGVRNVTVGRVYGLPYGFILGTQFFRVKRSKLAFDDLGDLKSSPGSLWVFFTSHTPHTPIERAGPPVACHVFANIGYENRNSTGILRHNCRHLFFMTASPYHYSLL